MSDEQNLNRCPKCQAPLPADAPQGLCAKCLLQAASTPTEAGQGKNVPVDIELVRRAFPNLEILDVQGCGGMGVVYKARQPKLDRFVALKLLSQSLASDPTFAERFLREARVLARLNHPSIVTVYDYGEAGGFYYLLMEYVDGINLRQALQGGRFTPQQALALVPKICEALQFAHEEGILHRDIKPENILLDSRGRVKIADFGIAKLLGEKVKETTLTASGAAIGTPQYMAPEQLEHRGDIDQRADIYSLGVVFYEMLTGELPLGRFAPPSTKTPVDPRVDDVVLRALEKEREKRFASAGEVKTKVEQITSEGSAGFQQTAPPPLGPGPTSLKHARCYFSTPDRMRNCFTWLGANIFICQGDLRLEADKLVYISQWGLPENIPLQDIEDVSIGYFKMWQSWWFVKYQQVSFLAVTFRKGTEWRTYHFTPLPHGSASLALDVNDWLQSIRGSVATLTSSAPRTSDPAALSVSGERAWKKKVRPAAIVLAMFWLAMVATPHNSPVHSTFLGIWSIILFWILWFSAIFIRANSALKHGDLDAVTLERPPKETASQGPGGTAMLSSAGGGGFFRRHWPHWRWGCLPLGLLVILITCTLSIVLPNLIKVSHQSPAATATQKTELILELSRSAQQERFPGLQAFRWRYYVPPNHVAFFTCYILSNGVPTLNEELSAWMAGRPDKTAEGTIQWACQNGVMLNPDLRDKQRWDMKLESTSSRGSKTVTGTVWTRGMESPETRRPNRTIHLPPDGLEPLLAFGSNVLMQVTLEKFPDGVYAGAKGSCGKGTNWLADLQGANR